MIITGTTRICQIIGHPIAQVRSPDMFNAHFEKAGIDAALVPVDLAPAQLGDFVAMVRGWHNAPGFIVTVPHKRVVVPFLDVLTKRAQRLQAVNVVRRAPDGTLHGDMLDGMGFMAATASHGFQAAGRRALVIGTGGAGSAIVDALCEAGIAALTLQDIDAGRVAEMRHLFGTAFPGVTIADSHDSLAAFDLVVNASPVGMNDTGELPLAPAMLSTLRPTALVADVVTKPPMTPFLVRAQAQGCKIQTGPEMTTGQLTLLGEYLQVF